MINSRYVVGVVGATRDIQRLDPAGAITKIARAVGVELTRQQQILLTGGIPSASIPSPVKSAAMEGACNAGTASKPARLVSVLPKPARSRIEYSDHVTVRHLVINSDMGDARNVINGYIPDVAIGIHGGAGTLSELAVARMLGTPVVLLAISGVVDTAEVLKTCGSCETQRVSGNDGEGVQIIPGRRDSSNGRRRPSPCSRVQHGDFTWRGRSRRSHAGREPG